MKPPNQPQAISTVPDHVRDPLLAYLGKGSASTGDVAKVLGLTDLLTLKYLQVLERHGFVEHRPVGDGRDAEWHRTRTKTRRSA
jgi:predicted ArsR family transcriptional regulator